MVSSGLVNNTTVSHYRLSIHLTLAFLILSTIFWLILNFNNEKEVKFFNFKKENIPFIILIFLIFVQIILGAFVSGLDAGKIYQTWPLMGHTFFPNDVFIITVKNLIDFDNHSLIQFYHRNLAYVISVYIIFLTFYVYSYKLKQLFRPLNFVLFFLFLQIGLGVLTLVSGLNIYLASGHQISSVILVFSAINLYYFRTK